MIACLHLGDLGPVLPPGQEGIHGVLLSYVITESWLSCFFLLGDTDAALTVAQDFTCAVL